MGNFNAADVIKAAATSTLGVISLIVLVLAFLAWRFFQQSTDKVKLAAFATMFFGAAGFVSAVLVEGGGGGVRDEAAVARPSGTSPSDPRSDAGSASSTVTAPSSSGGAVNIAGAWHDSDGFRYVVIQEGDVFTYKVFLNGEQTGWGAGNMMGSRLKYQFTDSKNGNVGDCEADVASDQRTIRGTCDDGSASWNFAIER